MEHFFLTGLPRSRTAWLSVLFTVGDSYCFHEAEKYARGDYGGLLESTPARFVGDSSSGLPLSGELDAYPGCPLVIIERDLETVRRSLCREVFAAGNRADDWEMFIGELDAGLLTLQAALEGLKDRDHMAVPYEKLDDLPTLERVWKYCVPGQDFDMRRADALRRMSIAVHWRREIEFLQKLIRSNALCQ